MDYFVLKGVNIAELNKPKTSRFKTFTKKRGNVKVKSFINQNGQKIRVAYTHNVVFDNISQGQWECWWDRHIIDGPIMTMPLKITKSKDIYKVEGEGHYCSLRCMLAMAIEEEKKQHIYKDPRYKHAIGNIYRLNKIIFPNDTEELIPADDWRILSVAGAGEENIQEFRSNNSPQKIKLPNVKFCTESTSYISE